MKCVANNKLLLDIIESKKKNKHNQKLNILIGKMMIFTRAFFDARHFRKKISKNFKKENYIFIKIK